MRKVCTIAVAIVLLSIGPLLAANKASVISLPRPASAANAAPDSINDGFIATAIFTANTDPEGLLPCFNCVTGPVIQTLLTAIPLGAVTEGQAITIMITGDDVNYSGHGVFTFNIKANANSVPVLTQNVAFDAVPAIWIAQFPITAPAPGSYIVDGVITTGANLTQQNKVTGTLVVGPAAN